MLKNKINIFSVIAMFVMIFISNPSIKAQGSVRSSQPNIQFSVQASSSTPCQHKDNSAVRLNPVKVTAMHESSVDDTKVTVNVEGVGTIFTSWSADVTDSLEDIEHFGPIRASEITISGSAILQNNNDGTYKIVVTGQTKNGNSIAREGSFTLIHIVQPNQLEQRVNIRFQFDKSITAGVF